MKLSASRMMEEIDKRSKMLYVKKAVEGTIEDSSKVIGIQKKIGDTRDPKYKLL